MKKKLSIILYLTVVSFSILILVFYIEGQNVYNLPNEIPITYSDVETINNDKIFGKNITASLDEKTINVGGEKVSIKTLIFKLFGFIPIKKIEANIIEDKDVYLGGMPIGFSIDVDGLIVIGNNSVLTKEGKINSVENSQIKKGDIILKINGNEVSSIDDLNVILNDNKYNGEELDAEILRGNQKLNIKLKPILDAIDNKYKLGLWVKNDAAGVGTLTYVETDTLNYGALGHPITDYETGVFVPAKGGNIFPCNVVGLNKGEKGVPGEIKGIFMQGKNKKGTIEKNTKFGVFGVISDKSKIVDSNKTAEVASRLTMKPGKATLVSNISGISEEYEIEIIKANYQPTSSDKSFVFKVTDDKLLELTGGIIQGMSGSPILQNGKVVGAVTHVFISDPTKGYGVYIDWMLAA